MRLHTVVTTRMEKAAPADNATAAFCGKKDLKKRGSPIQLVIPVLNNPFSLLHWFLGFVILLGCAACQPPSQPDVEKDQSPQATAVQNTVTGKDTAYFAQRMTDLSHWASYRPTEKNIMRSSHTVERGSDVNIFNGNDYKLDGSTWYTLADEQGPGCITRFWLSDSAKGRLRFYFDNEQTPRLEIDSATFFNEWMKDTAPYLILSASDTGCGQVSYIPMPFGKHCTVMCDTIDPPLKYQINFLKLPAGEKVVSFPAEPGQRTKDALSQANKFFSTTAFHTFYSVQKREETVTLENNKPQMLVNLPGPAAIDYFEIQTSNISMDKMNNIFIEMYWDGMDTPSVQCNLRQFFCNIDFQRNWNSIPLGYIHDKKADLLYSQFYMPFSEKAQIFLVNQNNDPIQLTFRYHINIDQKKMPKYPLYFYVRAQQKSFYNGLIYPLIEFEGSGNFVGMDMVAYTESPKNKFFYLEGDTFAFVDGETQPSLTGTGLDNQFNTDNHLATTNSFWFPTHGCIGKVNSVSQNSENPVLQTGSNLFRFQLLDAIPFRSSLFMVNEIGDPIQYTQFDPPEPGSSTIFNWVCYWYGKMPEEPMPRKEQAFYFQISENKESNPTANSAVMLGPNLHIQLPKGEWWINYAPVWDLSKVSHEKKVVE